MITTFGDLVTALGRARPIACHSANGLYRRNLVIGANMGKNRKPPFCDLPGRAEQ
jgi:hypothetical protein